MTTEITLVESLAPTTEITVAKGKRWRARIIEANRWGSSAYYPADVLERDGARVFTAGLPMYANHATDTESYDRPERSINDLVGKLTSDAIYESDGLYADVEFYDSFVDRISELSEDVGLSVKATGLTEEAEMDGRYGPVLVGLLAADSVDVVTKAGAGGKLTSILESDRTPAGRPIEQEGTQHVADVTKEDFDALKTALTEAIAGLSASIAESLKPAEEVKLSDEEREAAEAEAKAKAEAEQGEEVDVVAVATKVAEAHLPTSAIARVAADVKAGTDLEEAVKKESDYIASAAQAEGGVVIKESKSDEKSGLSYAVSLLG